jgi:opacity protein-like surface antigen
MGKKLGFLVVSIAAVTQLNAFAQSSGKNPTFTPVLSESAEVQNVSEPSRIGMGLYINSLLPTTQPFESNINGTQKFRYQNATAAGLELTYTLSPSFEVGMLAGYEQYTSRAQTGTGTILEFQKVKYWQVPVLGMLRYKLMNQDISPELEAGLGYSHGKVKIGSTNLGSLPVSETLTSYRGYLAAGVGLAWTESSSLHASAGYAMYRFGDKTYTNTLISVTQSNAAGIFVKTSLRYKF